MRYLSDFSLGIGRFQEFITSVTFASTMGGGVLGGNRSAQRVVWRYCRIVRRAIPLASIFYGETRSDIRSRQWITLRTVEEEDEPMLRRSIYG